MVEKNWAGNVEFGAGRWHWPSTVEEVCGQLEAMGLGIFMFSACAFGVLLQFPGSPFYGLIPSGVARRVLFGVAMGLTSIAIVYSPLGQQSGAHLNPSVTLTFLRLKKIQAFDAAFQGIVASVRPHDPLAAWGLFSLNTLSLLRNWHSHPAPASCSVELS